MKARLKTGRLVLDEKAVESLNKILGALMKESSHMKTSPSKIVSMLVSDYEEKFFVKEKKGLISRLFDKKSYIKHLLLTTDSPDELVEKIAELHVEGVKRKKKTSSKASEAAPDISDQEGIK